MELEQKQHYRAILNTIDFFSQRLHIDQIVHYGYKIFEDLTLIRSGAILTINESGNAYIVRETCNLPQSLESIPAKDCHHEFASKNGFILDDFEVQSRYFQKGFLLTYNVDLIVPLIVDDSLYGFIIATENDRPSGIKNREFLNRFCDLLNLALEKAISYERTEEMCKEISKRKFGIASFSHTMGILMTALDQTFIVNMCLDVIRELTASSVTSIFTARRPNQLILSAYLDIVHHKECFAELTTREDADVAKVIYHVEKDRAALEEIFISIDPLEKLEAEYIVFLVKKKIIGCITLGAPVSEVPYDKQLLDQIKGLASVMYIAINNATQFEVIKEERNKMATQLSALEHLKKSISIINSSDSLEELCSHVMDTLQYGFSVEEAFILIETRTGPYASGIGGLTDKLTLEAKIWLSACDDEIIHYTSRYESPLVDQASNCFVCLPLRQEGVDKDTLGYLVINRMSVPLDEGQSLILEALANSISPIINQFLIIKKYQQDYIKKPQVLLNELFEKYNNESQLYEIPYYIYMKEKKVGLSYTEYKHETLENGDYIAFGTVELLFLYENCEKNDYKKLENDDFEALRRRLFINGLN